MMNRYSWILTILLLITILICLFVKDAPKQKSSIIPEQKQVDLSNEFDTLLEEESILAGGFYNKIQGKDKEESMRYLKRKGREAQRIVPQFPNFPDMWLLPPTSKGNNSSIGERYCVEFLELLFPGHKFKKIRPKWLRNPKTNRPLELDGYCDELMIAIEYQGIQHYIWPNFTNCTKEEYIAQRERDQVKEEICIKNNICLIKIPYTVEHKRIPLAIYAKLLDSVPGLHC